MTIIGIDPGKSGAICVMLDGEVVYAKEVPIAGKELDLWAIADIFANTCMEALMASDGKVIAVVEKVGAMPGQGVTSMFSFGKSFGMILGVLAGQRITTELVAPQTWKGRVLKDSKKDKDAAIAYCRRAFPSTSLLPTERSKKPSDGIADAICIAEYGRREFAGGADR